METGCRGAAKQVMRINKSFFRTGGILAAILLGALMPQAHVAGFLIRYLIMTMLLLVFLRVEAPQNAFRWSHVYLMIANLAMGPASFGVVWLCGGSRDLALAAFFAGITPTATAAPVVMGFLKGREEYVVVAFLLTTVAVAFGMPLLLPPLLGSETPGLCGQVFLSLALVLGGPLAGALLLRKFYAPSRRWPSKLGDFSFGLWLAALFLIAANASDFLHESRVGALETLASVCLVTLAVCAANFLLGYWLGGKEFRREASQSLGQKNTTLTIYLALLYANPAVALGPTCYVLWHNLWNAFQLSRVKVNDTEIRL